MPRDHSHAAPHAWYSDAQWSRVHLQWHLPSAVHDCGGICLNLGGTVLNGSHWSTFAWHCDWQSQSTYHGPGDKQALIYRWERARVSLIDWRDCHWATGALRNHLPTAGWYDVGVRIGASVRLLMLPHECLRIDVSVSAGGHYTDYPEYLECGDR